MSFSNDKSPIVAPLVYSSFGGGLSPGRTLEMASNEDIQHQISLAVQSIGWSYAVFWSETQPGVLKWGNGFYNGEIKTKSKTQVTEQNGDDIYARRSEQLRELFESLAASESNYPQAKKLHSALSPEDLSEPEWFYLVCMSFIFHSGQELPGKAFGKAQHVWLSNVHLADNKVFGRSLLAKSASIKTVACFPVPGGVVELGATDKITEDIELVQRITNCLRDDKWMSLKRNDLKPQKPISSIETVCTEPDILDANFASIVSPLTSTSELGLAELEDSFMADSFNQELPHLQSWQFFDEDMNNYIIQHEAEATKITDDTEKIEHDQVSYAQLTSLNDEMHYQSVISAVLQTSVIGSQHGNTKMASSFTSYKKGERAEIMKSDSITQHQRMLKKVLMEVPKMYYNGILESGAKGDKNVAHQERDDTCFHEADDTLVDVDLPEAEETGLNHVLAERRRREKLKRRFSVLRSLVPTTTKVDKVSILDDTIKYLRELERRIVELESAQVTTTNTRSATDNVRKCHGQENTETTSEKYEQEESTNPKQSKKKRKSR